MRALVYDTAFRGRARRRQTWGFGLLAFSAGIWLWIASQLLLPFTGSGRHDDLDCESRVFYTAHDDRDRPYDDYADAEGTRCSAERDWAGLLALLLLSLPTAVVGTILYTSGSTAHRLSEHAAEVNRLTEFPQG
ncbi:hypothetical protein AB0D94_25565 [Streptomyces sp. NPDC048255]|uniref:hypothetical protein n=1 Tax=Streptomyces sp. NPDC048255 TaxID=3154713 RepID=UPI003405369D